MFKNQFRLKYKLKNMQALKIEKTLLTPKVVFDSSNRIFEISGKSMPENAIFFYQPVMEWFQIYLDSPNPCTELVFKLDYFNKPTSNFFISFFKLLNQHVKDGVDIKVNWYYPEYYEDTLEAGHAYASLVNIPFTFYVMPN
jgi:hypothetical protein